LCKGIANNAKIKFLTTFSKTLNLFFQLLLIKYTVHYSVDNLKECGKNEASSSLAILYTTKFQMIVYVFHWYISLSVLPCFGRA